MFPYPLIWFVIALPLAGYIVLALTGSRMPHRAVTIIGAGTVGVSLALALLISFWYFIAPPPGLVYTDTLWTWVRVGNFTPGIAVYLDPLAVVMMLVVTFVGFLIHLYSVEYMGDDRGYSRFFAYMNLFVGAMLILVLANNLLFLFLGWEGVGLCSYLLIGFWYTDLNNVHAANKAFIVTRIGDTSLAVGLFLLFTHLGTLNIQEILARAAAQWPVGFGLAIATAALVLGGAVGKSAQLPLQVWLPDAMAGPTPVSALIHAATMVTAGVYLIARLYVIFQLAPPVMLLTAIIGAATLLLSATSALVQRDIKRVLAYSTISQVGYMFLGLGAGAWSAAIFHLMTHAFFKALLFLAAGAVILGLHHEQDIFRMGGLRKSMPLAFWTFLIGASSLAAVPFITAGYFSKDEILAGVWNAYGGTGHLLWVAGLLGAFLTAIYAFRLVFLVFFGEERRSPEKRPGLLIAVPLVILAALAIGGGWVQIPKTVAGLPLFGHFLHGAFTLARTKTDAGAPGMLAGAAAIASLGGIALAYLLYLVLPAFRRRLAEQPIWTAMGRFLITGWGFDWLYEWLIVRPYLWLARVNRDDVIDLFYRGVSWTAALSYRGLQAAQTGNVRWYAAGVAAGALIILAFVVYGL